MAGVRRVYGKPWSKLARGVQLDRKTLQRLGRALVRAVREEAAKQMAKERSMKQPGSPEGIPQSKRFLDSFSYRIVGKSTVELVSSWPFIHQIIEGRDPYPMTWLTRDAGVRVVPMAQDDGTVIFRMAPRHVGGAWVHPGWARHTFIERGIRKGRQRAAEIVTKEAIRQIVNGDPRR